MNLIKIDCTGVRCRRRTAYENRWTTVASQETEVKAQIASEISLLDIPLPPPSTAPTEIMKLDKDTPDHHVPRDPRLIRLTGVHPFNVEAPLTALFNEGG
jgi:nitrate reductase (NAD(P)H)